MKTRQEMIYDFMVAVNANADVSKAWREVGNSAKSYQDYIFKIAEKMADKYLESLG